MEQIVLNNGVAMPTVGFGVYQIDDLNEAERCVSDALDVGYRLIDTAACYGNEAAVGAAIAKSGVKRDEIFVTTKLWVQDYGYESALKAFEASRKKLGLDYVDLYLAHKPYGDYYGAWRAMEKLYKEGVVRAIGVTSFWNERLADLFTCNEIKPALNQIETNVWRQQWASDAFMAKHGIARQAWAPFAEGNNDVFNAPILKEIGAKHGKTTGQVMLRWLIQRGFSVIPKTVRKARMEENFNVFDFSLDESDMAAIKSMDTGKSTIYDETDPEVAIWIGTYRYSE